MKTRVGFVSNSSSSSFLLLGKEFDIKNITPKMILEKEIYALGDHLSDGQDIFRIKNIEELAFLKALKEIDSDYEFTFVESYVISIDDSEGSFDIEKLPKKGTIQYFSVEKDYNSSNNLDELKFRYDSYNKTELIMQRYLRSEKINRIENNKE